MHFEILVEDQSGKKALDVLVRNIVGPEHTFKVHAYKGIGRIPKQMRNPREANKRILMENLPKLLRGHGTTQAGRRGFAEAVILICDLDNNCRRTFREELYRVLDACNPKPRARFCLAIEEGEAWLLGDLTAIKKAYPDANEAVLRAYVNDSICGTWEKLADAVYPGGASALSRKGWQAIGAEKARWAERVSPLMSIESNLSPSFRYFCRKLKELASDQEPVRTLID